MKQSVKVIEAERYGRCVSLRQFAELVGEPMPDISDELAGVMLRVWIGKRNHSSNGIRTAVLF